MKKVFFLLCICSAVFQSCEKDLNSVNLIKDGSTGTWVQKADFAGGGRSLTAHFRIGNKGYAGLGTPLKNDFWQYDPENDTWTQIADFPGGLRMYALGLNIGDKGYAGTGLSLTKRPNEDTYVTAYTNDFWEYDPATNCWTRKADFKGAVRNDAVSFSVGNKGYMGTGTIFGESFQDIWEFDPQKNTWTRKADFPGRSRFGAAGFHIGDKGYIGIGAATSSAADLLNDFWQYDSQNDKWTKKADFPEKQTAGLSFSINNNGYILTGSSGSVANRVNNNTLYEYNPETNAWITKTVFPPGPRKSIAGFSLGSKVYLGTGSDIIEPLNKDFWEYTP